MCFPNRRVAAAFSGERVHPLRLPRRNTLIPRNGKEQHHTNEYDDSILLSTAEAGANYNFRPQI